MLWATLRRDPPNEERMSLETSSENLRPIRSCMSELGSYPPHPQAGLEVTAGLACISMAASRETRDQKMLLSHSQISDPTGMG